MKRVLMLSVVAAVIASGLFYALSSRAVETKPEAKIAQTNVDTRVLARALNLQIYAFDLPIPEQSSSLIVWMERWTREAAEPQIFSIFNAEGLVGDGSGKLTVCLPTASHPQGLADWSTHGGKAVSMGSGATTTPNESSMSAGFKLPISIDVDESTGSTFIQPRTMVLGQDIPLLALQFNKAGLVNGKTEHVEKDNDVTWYLRARFISGHGFHGAVAWKDGKIDIQ